MQFALSWDVIFLFLVLDYELFTLYETNVVLLIIFVNKCFY